MKVNYRTRNRRCQDYLNASLAWWKYDKHNPFTQYTSTKKDTQHLQLNTIMTGKPLAM
jgi:hypothetical protein